MCGGAVTFDIILILVLFGALNILFLENYVKLYSFGCVPFKSGRISVGTCTIFWMWGMIWWLCGLESLQIINSTL